MCSYLLPFVIANYYLHFLQDLMFTIFFLSNMSLLIITIFFDYIIKYNWYSWDRIKLHCKINKTDNIFKSILIQIFKKVSKAITSQGIRWINFYLHLPVIIFRHLWESKCRNTEKGFNCKWSMCWWVIRRESHIQNYTRKSEIMCLSCVL